MTKTCRDCGEDKPLDQFTPMGRSYTARCLPCRAAYMSEYRRSHIDHIEGHNREYRLTSVNGVIMKAYHSLRWRVIRQRSTLGMEIPTKAEFYAWALKQKKLPALMERYRDSGFKRGLAPAFSRIDLSKGYGCDNLYVTTHSECVRRGRAKLAQNVAHARRKNLPGTGPSDGG